MNKTAIINNKTYVFIEQVQRIDSAEPIVICSDSEGNHLGCAIDVWQHSAPNTSAVTRQQSKGQSLCPCFTAGRMYLGSVSEADCSLAR